MKTFMRWLMVTTTVWALVLGARAQEKPAVEKPTVEKKAKKKAAVVVEEKTAQAEAPKAAMTKKAEAAVEEKKAPVAEAAKKAAPVAETKTVETKPAAKKMGAAKAAAAPYTGGVVNLNTATKTQLEGLPGVGDANADHIIKGRPYKSVEELLTRKIVQARYYNAFKEHVTAK